MIQPKPFIKACKVVLELCTFTLKLEHLLHTCPNISTRSVDERTVAHRSGWRRREGNTEDTTLYHTFCMCLSAATESTEFENAERAAEEFRSSTHLSRITSALEPQHMALRSMTREPATLICTTSTMSDWGTFSRHTTLGLHVPMYTVPESSTFACRVTWWILWCCLREI